MPPCTPLRIPDMPRVMAAGMAMAARLTEGIVDVRLNPRPGMVNALIEAAIAGVPPRTRTSATRLPCSSAEGSTPQPRSPPTSLEWLERAPSRAGSAANRTIAGLLDSATEEFLRVFTPAPGDGRTVTCEYVLSGQKLEEPGDRL